MKNLKSIFIYFCIFAFCICCGVTGYTTLPRYTPTYVIACSDYQPGSAEGGKPNLTSILNALKTDAGITTADGFLCCGDYDIDNYGNRDETLAGINAIKDVFEGTVSDENMLFAQGNHDPEPGTVGIAQSGGHDADKYGVFVINEDDYAWSSDGSEDVVRNTAQNLTGYLNEKLKINYKKPIFVVSHLPLHYSGRTYTYGDCSNASLLFNALNEAGKKGLNIVYMFGHNHSSGWDEHLGGSAVYLGKGDEILIAQAGQAECKTEYLSFTYLNPGYIGYYSNSAGADSALTMTLFEISDSKLTITRYDKTGKHNLKTSGVATSFDNEIGINANDKVYTSPQEVDLRGDVHSSTIENTESPPFTRLDEKMYARIGTLDELKDGGRYVLVNQTNFTSIIKPKSVMKNKEGYATTIDKNCRVGFDLKSFDYPSAQTITLPKDSNYEWTFTKVEGGWRLGNGEGYARIVENPVSKLDAVFDDVGDIFILTMDGYNFEFSNGTYVLNYNSRGLINGYEAGFAKVSVYEEVDYTAENQFAFKQGEGLRVSVGDMVELSLINQPNMDIIIYSENPDIAYVDKTGKLYAKEIGEARIIATDNNGHIAVCKVLVGRLIKYDIADIAKSGRNLSVSLKAYGVNKSAELAIALYDSKDVLRAMNIGDARELTEDGVELKAALTISDDFETEYLKIFIIENKTTMKTVATSGKK